MENPSQNQQQNNKNTLLKLIAIEGSYTTFDNSSEGIHASLFGTPLVDSLRVLIPQYKVLVI
jgi:hypothetical protein